MFAQPEAQKSMAEGQSLLRFRDQRWLYGDEPAVHGMQLGTSPGLVTRTHTKTLKFPACAKNGSASLAPRVAAGWLQLTSRSPQSSVGFRHVSPEKAPPAFK
jgi:hypothetical protein